MIKNTLKAGLVAAACTVSFAANANLITNGGFESMPNGDTDVEAVTGGTIANGNGTWTVYSSSDVEGWDGSNIETWNKYYNVNPFEGNFFAELNAHGERNYIISQTFNTEVGKAYDLSFEYQARNVSDNEKFEVQVFNSAYDQLLFSSINNDASDWTNFTKSFVADSAETTLQFYSLNGGKTTGNFLDNVSVTDVAEPGTLALLGLGLAGLGLARRRTA